MKPLAAMKRIAELIGFACFVMLAIVGLVTVLSSAPFSVAHAQGVVATPAPAADKSLQNTQASSAIPNVFNYQGILRRGTDNALANGYFEMTFGIYDAAAGGNPKFTQTFKQVVVRDGIFNVVLGNDPENSIPSTIPFLNAPLYLGIQVKPDDGEMLPRQRLYAVPWALQATTATTLMPGATVNGLNVSGANLVVNAAGSYPSGWGHGIHTWDLYANGTIGLGANGNRAAYITSGGSAYFGDKVGIGTASPGASLDVRGNVASNGVIGFSNTTQTTSPYGVYISAPASQSMAISTNSTERVRFAEDGDVGIGTKSPLARLHVHSPGTTNATSGLWVGAEGRGGKPTFQVRDDGTVLIGGLYSSSTRHACLYPSMMTGTYYFSSCSSAAEYVPTIDNGSGYPEAGDLVSIVPSATTPYGDEHAPFVVVKSATPNDARLLGFIIDPGLGADGEKLNDHYLPLAIYGYFPAKVTLENGPIKRGDAITSSSKPGYGMKAISPGRVIGYALEDATSEGVIQIVAQSGDYLGDAPERIRALEEQVATLRTSSKLLQSQLDHLSERIAAIEEKAQGSGR